MKPNYVHTSSSQSSRRNLGDQPDIGPVARIPGAAKRLEMSKRRGRRSKRESHLTDRRRLRQLNARKFAVRLWVSLILVASSVVLLTVSFLWLRAQGDRRDNAPVWVAQESQSALKLTDFTPPTEREAIAIIHSALTAPDAETLKQFVHECEEATIEEMHSFFAATQDRDGRLANHQWIGSNDTETLQIQSVILAFDQDGKLNYRTGMLVPTGAGEWRLDFPSYSRWSAPPIELMERPDGHPGGRVRVFLSRDFYFNGPFADDRQWACYTITSPDIETSGFGYCTLDSPEYQAIEKAFAQGARQIRVTIDLERVEGAQSRQFLIKSMLGYEWLAVRPVPITP